MDLTFRNLWEWTKLTVRAPATASALVKAAKLPLDVSFMMIVLAGVVSGVASGFLDFLIGSPPMEFILADGRSVSFERSGPFAQGLYAVVTGLAMAFAVYKVGAWMGGKGSLADIMAVIAVLQIVMTVLVVAQTAALIVLPLIGFVLLMFGLYVFFRGLGHAVNIGHDFNSMGRSIAVILLSFLAVVVAVLILVAVFGIGPQGAVTGASV